MSATRLAYGEQGLEVALPPEAFVVEPRYVPGVADPMTELARVLREPVAGPPLRSIVQPGQTVAVAICDGDTGPAAGPGRSGDPCGSGRHRRPR